MSLSTAPVTGSAADGLVAVERLRLAVAANALRRADSLQRQAEGNWSLYA